MAMTEVEFDKAVRAQLTMAGATEIDVHVGSDIISASCKHGGAAYELSLRRGMGNEQQVYRQILEAVKNFGPDREQARG